MKNYQSMGIINLGFSYICYTVGIVPLLLSIIPLLFIIFSKLDVLNFESRGFKDFKEMLVSDSKILRYIKFDCMNGPIFYVISGAIWVISTIYLVRDLVEFGEVSDDVPLMFFSISLVTLVMIFVGYIKEWRKL